MTTSISPPIRPAGTPPDMLADSPAAAFTSARSLPCATALDSIARRLDEAVDARVAANRAHSRLWRTLAELLRLARQNPEVYLRPEGLTQRDVIELAEDSVAFDVGLRLHLSSGQVRTLAHQAQVLHDRLPRLQAAFDEGTTTPAHINAALDLLVGWIDDEAVRLFDDRLAYAATTLTPSLFRARARREKQKLMFESPEVRHARAVEGRKVGTEAADDGMAWIHALVSASDAVRIASRLNATARAIQKKTSIGGDGWRSRDQIRADLAVEWLAGDGTSTAARVRPVLLVPMLSLIGAGDEPFELRGYGPIDRASAARLFEQAPSFLRVGTDPFTGENLTLDRTRYRPTQGQRHWIATRFAHCIDPTCSRPVDDTEVDHLEEWVRDHGRTNDDNLLPLCEKGNRRKNLSWFDYRRNPDGRLGVTTPTGLTVAADEPPF